MKKIEVVDFLKGFSISTIVIMHLFCMYLQLPGIVNKGLALGGAGVHIFILCSGFGLYLSYLNKKISYKSFLKKRFTKIYLPYIFVILVSSLVPYMYINSDRVKAVFSHIFLFKMFNENYECSFGVQFWFVSTIIQFYILFYILVLLKDKMKNNKNFFIISIGISISWWISTCILGKSDVRVWNSFFLQYLWEFSLGMILADIYFVKKEIKIPSMMTLIIYSIIGLGITGVTGIIGGVLKSFNDIPSMIGYGSAALIIYSLKNKFINGIFIKISKISYEWYLTHILIFSIIFNLNIRINKAILSIIAIVVSLIVAKVYNRLINICLKLKNKTNINVA